MKTMQLQFEVEDESEAHVVVVDATNTVLLWAYQDTPAAYRKIITLPDDIDTSRAFVALIPATYTRNIDHITRDPYFGPAFLDVYKLADGTTLYVGA